MFATGSSPALCTARRAGSPPSSCGCVCRPPFRSGSGAAYPAAMLLRWVELRDFRNHAHTMLKPIPQGLVVAVGANGEGKTNLLEGMHFLYALQSPRASASEPLVRHGAASGFVRG